MVKKYFPPKPKSIQLTKEGLEESQVEFDRLTKEREEVLVRLQTAREMGDLSENGAYTYAKLELRDTDRKLRHLSKLLKYGVVVESSNDGEIGFDSTVIVNNGSEDLTFHLVSGYESDPKEKKLSVYSPIGKALLGKKKGESVEVEVPAGKVVYKILKIS